MIYVIQPLDTLQRIQQEYGGQATGWAIEHVFSRLSAELQVAGVSTFVVAGGETSGTTIEILQVKHLSVGKTITPDVPRVFSFDLVLALKSGNFSDEDFSFTAQEYILWTQ